MFTVNVAADVRQPVAALNAMKAGLGDRAIVSALNKTGAQAKTRMARGIGDEFNLPQATIKEFLSVKRARRAGNNFTADLLGNPYGLRKRSLNLIRFTERKITVAQHRKRLKAGDAQLRFKIKRSGGQITVQGAFIGNKGRTVFIRTGAGRLPIKPLQTIGVPQMFNTKRVQQPVIPDIRDDFLRYFEHEVSRLMSSLK